MCGNFGLLLLASSVPASSVHIVDGGDITQYPDRRAKRLPDKMDASLHRSMHEVARLRGTRVQGGSMYTLNRSSTGFLVDNPIVKNLPHASILSPLQILSAQTSSTEVRGGQAGGISSLNHVAGKGGAVVTRSRCVARKRYPLAADLVEQYGRDAKGRGQSTASAAADATFIGHTRFATSSVNQVVELHPHEWTPFRLEEVWGVDQTTGASFTRSTRNVGVHITHNGDFDALDAYGGSMVNAEFGYWLERVLHVTNDLAGDSVKIAGFFDVLRVQGRWGPACRLAFVRLLKSASDVTGGEPLTKNSPSTFPVMDYFEAWGRVFEEVWEEHVNNVIKFIPGYGGFYRIDASAERQFITAVTGRLFSHNVGNSLMVIGSPSSGGTGNSNSLNNGNNLLQWTTANIESFAHFATRGFLRGDCYNVMTEFLSRAEGSFGIQAHCSLEGGVVVISSKGQPMSMSYDPDLAMCLFGSEASAVAVPVESTGTWLSQRLDLDSKGEITRIGRPRQLLEGSFQYSTASTAKNDNSSERDDIFGAPPIPEPEAATASTSSFRVPGLWLHNGVQILSYSLVTSREFTAIELLARASPIEAAPIPYDPSVDLVGGDLAMTPAIIQAIEHAWSDESSIEYISGQALSERLIACMRHRISTNSDSTDLLIGGVEASLWVAEQWAADLRAIFPHLNVVTVSSNKLLGLTSDNAGKVFFPGADSILRRRIDDHTCVLLISQSGQTFPTLHATRSIASLVGDTQRLWLMTGCFSSKMELAMCEEYKNKGIHYAKDRVFNNYSGMRPAEPSSVAVAATFHSLTRLLLHIIRTVRREIPSSRIVHPWEVKQASIRISTFFKTIVKKRQSRWQPGMKRSASYNRSKSLTSSQHSGGSRHVGYCDMDYNSNSGGGGIINSDSSSAVTLMNLSDGDIEDIHKMTSLNLLSDLVEIVGYDEAGDPRESPLHAELVHRGKVWAEHIKEPWTVLLLVGLYFMLSIGLGVTLFVTVGTLIADGIYGVHEPEYSLRFSLLNTHQFSRQPIGWTLLGLGLQICDAVLFGYLVKLFTFGCRLWGGRPLWARVGKRTLVIVETPCNHQLLENFVSKLFSQAYSFVSIDVHGASGLDHFVHRFTHRVVRGVMLAVGRPDGRMATLAKSESAVVLACKQAAFIQNPSYGGGAGSGVDIVTVGHNPFSPSMGKTCANVYLPSSNRQRFVDEYIYDRLFLARKPFSGGILQSLSRKYRQRGLVETRVEERSLELKSFKDILIHRDLTPLEAQRESELLLEELEDLRILADTKDLPYGCDHIDPRYRGDELLKDFIMSIPKELMSALKKKVQDSSGGDSINVNSGGGGDAIDDVSGSGVEMRGAIPVSQDEDTVSRHSSEQNDGARGLTVEGVGGRGASARPGLSGSSNDPSVRLAFNHSLDNETQGVESSLGPEQTFYECRIASIERYISFCVMFHAMARECRAPLFRVPWDIARSQSYLRVATTASPISAADNNATDKGDLHSKLSAGAQLIVKSFLTKLRKIKSNF